MLGIHDYWLFVMTGVLLNLTPGQDTMFIIGQSLSGGRPAGVAAALGIAVGSLGHTLAAALGLSVLLAASPWAFKAVKLAGAAYLIYLGARLWIDRPKSPAQATGQGVQGSARAAFTQGIVTNLLNPKVALFFLALLPQFIDPASHEKTAAFLALGATFIATGLSWCLVLALAAASLQSFFARNPDARTLIDRCVGLLFAGLGLKLAL